MKQRIYWGNFIAFVVVGLLALVIVGDELLGIAHVWGLNPITDDAERDPPSVLVDPRGRSCVRRLVDHAHQKSPLLGGARMGKYSFSQEPAVYIGLLTAIIDAVAVFFPSALTSDQKVVLVGLVTTLVPVVLSFVVRSQVTPVANLPATPAPFAKPTP